MDVLRCTCWGEGRNGIKERVAHNFKDQQQVVLYDYNFHCLLIGSADERLRTIQSVLIHEQFIRDRNMNVSFMKVSIKEISNRKKTTAIVCLATNQMPHIFHIGAPDIKNHVDLKRSL